MDGCKNNKIKNRASVTIELCGKEFTFESNETQAEKVKLEIKKTQSCDFALEGEKIKYTVRISNQSCVKLFDTEFKDTLDHCVEYVQGSFTFNGEHKTPEVKDGVIKFNIPELKACETVTITFEVEVKEGCFENPCGDDDGEDGGDDDKEDDPREHDDNPDSVSESPQMNKVIKKDAAVTGYGVRKAEIKVTFPSGKVVTGTVDSGGEWFVAISETLLKDDIIYATQTEKGKSESGRVQVTVTNN